jgi:hypothetical protein
VRVQRDEEMLPERTRIDGFFDIDKIGRMQGEVLEPVGQEPRRRRDDQHDQHQDHRPLHWKVEPRRDERPLRAANGTDVDSLGSHRIAPTRASCKGSYPARIGLIVTRCPGKRKRHIGKLFPTPFPHPTSKTQISP